MSNRRDTLPLRARHVSEAALHGSSAADEKYLDSVNVV
jgi:hypothetical protein